MKSLLTLTLLSFLLSLGFAQEAKTPVEPTAPVVPVAPSDPATKTKTTGTVIMTTSIGEIHIKLDPSTAPKTVENFLKYVDTKFYDNTIFHRVIKGFMIQGGGFKIDSGTLKQKQTVGSVVNESKNTPSNTRGTIAMARRGDPNSATSQFFINLVDNKGLDYPQNNGGYTTFGKVIKGMDIVDKIASVPVQTKNRMQNVPNETITIKSIARAK